MRRKNFWRTNKTLGDFFGLQRGTTYKSALLGSPGPILLGLATIHRNGGFRGDAVKTYGGESADRILVKPGELYLSLKDVTQSADLLGAVARLPLDAPHGRLTQDTVKLVPKGGNSSLRYLYWLLRTPQYRAYCRAHATGTTNLGLAREDFLAFKVPPITNHRQGITNALDAIEGRIEVNRRMSETLEALAESIFTERVKEASNDWTESRPLDSIARFDNGFALQKFPPEGKEFLPVIKIAQIRSGKVEGSDRASTNIDPSRVVDDGDILFSWSGSLECVVWTGGRGALNQHVFKVTPNGLPKWFVYYWIRRHLNEFRRIAAGKATTMGHIQRHHLAEALVRVPRERELKAVGAAIEPIWQLRTIRRLESTAMESTRDLLLGQLISGIEGGAN